jgi:FAD/FMN-containing dehydrogenase
MASHVNPTRQLTDPLPVLGVAAPLVDDVTRLNSSLVERVFHVRNEEDIQKVVRMARERGVKVSCRGTQHTMGAHTIASSGYVIDCKNLRQLSYDPVSGICTTGPGNTWAVRNDAFTCMGHVVMCMHKPSALVRLYIAQPSLDDLIEAGTEQDLIKMLNNYGCSPRTMQSYSTFSVGGSIAVGAHGITTDVPVSESVLWCKLVDAEGNLIHVQQGDELLRYVLGGYGLFGIVYEVALTVADNTHLTMDMMQTDLNSFPQLYEAVLQVLSLLALLVQKYKY